MEPKQKTTKYMTTAKNLTVAAAPIATALAVQAAASAVIPAAMSCFGTVVYGQGTMHAVGGAAWVLQKITVASVLGPVGVVASVPAALAVYHREAIKEAAQEAVKKFQSKL